MKKQKQEQVRGAIIGIVILLCLLGLFILTMDLATDPGEQRAYYCHSTYGTNYQMIYDGDVGYYKCVTIDKEGNITQWYFTKDDLNCKAKFFKLHDCPDLK